MLESKGEIEDQLIQAFKGKVIAKLGIVKKFLHRK